IGLLAVRIDPLVRKFRDLAVPVGEEHLRADRLGRRSVRVARRTVRPELDEAARRVGIDGAVSVTALAAPVSAQAAAHAGLIAGALTGRGAGAGAGDVRLREMAGRRFRDRLVRAAAA